MKALLKRIQDYYEQNELKCDLGFFLGGVVFDIFTLSDIDDPISILQQVIYLLLIGLFLFYDFLGKQEVFTPSPRLSRVWEFRDLIIHFLLGSLLSLYSLFFLKSSSIFASFVFIGLMLALMVLNELKVVQQNKINLKIALYYICVFSFFSMMFPIILGFIGWGSFLLSIFATGGALFLAYWLLQKRVASQDPLRRGILLPGGSVLATFVVFYLLGWIPPVPMSVQEIGIYHHIEKSQGVYTLSHERPWWKFWRSGDQEFVAEPGDKVNVFVRIFSPARFNDSVILHWQKYSAQDGWMTSDRIPMQVTGGRDGGYRGFATKQNYSAGEWRILVETTDGREVGRLKFWIDTIPVAYEKRSFQLEKR